MSIEVKTAPTIAKAAARSGVLVVPVHEGLAWGPGAGEVADALGDDLTAFLAASDFTGAAGKTAAAPGGALGFARVLLVGVGTE
ncbi:MAG: leucyl aminopeptidase, partial [Acidimicrobiia bacterium]|nr:leucyl aminopeptidase [Acidimicrobiia bacterium]